MFALDPAFAAGSRSLVSLPLCEVRLQLDARFPWLVLIPRRARVTELEDLDAADRARLGAELVLAGAAVRSIGEALGRPVAKLNIGLIGNITPQLHAHVVGRRRDDAAWPAPVWGFGTAEPYAAWTVDAAIGAAVAVLGH